MAVNNFKRTIVEQGVVLSKIIKDATNQFTSKDGSIVPAQPIRYVVTVASSSKVDKEFGLKDPVILEFKVDEVFFAKLKYLSPVQTEYEYSANGPKAISLGILNQ